jgi:hypothetical protein
MEIIFSNRINSIAWDMKSNSGNWIPIELSTTPQPTATPTAPSEPIPETVTIQYITLGIEYTQTDHGDLLTWVRMELKLQDLSGDSFTLVKPNGEPFEGYVWNHWTDKGTVTANGMNLEFSLNGNLTSSDYKLIYNGEYPEQTINLKLVHLNDVVIPDLTPSSTPKPTVTPTTTPAPTQIPTPSPTQIGHTLTHTFAYTITNITIPDGENATVYASCMQEGDTNRLEQIVTITYTGTQTASNCVVNINGYYSYSLGTMQPNQQISKPTYYSCIRSNGTPFSQGINVVNTAGISAQGYILP